MPEARLTVREVMSKACILFVIGASVLSVPVSSQQIESRIVQVKMDRLYFDAGSESGVAIGAPFQIDCGGREIINGVIEYAGPGIAFSLPMPVLDTIAIDSSCTARLTIAAIDPSAVIVIGTDMPLGFLDAEHEPLFIREADTVLPNLVDSAQLVGNTCTLHLRRGIRFSDGSSFDAQTLAGFFTALKRSGRSYLVRYFFSRLLPPDSGGIELPDDTTLALHFYHPFPRADYFLSHPDFVIVNSAGRGTGPLAEIAGPGIGMEKRTFIPNRFYRGKRPDFSQMEIIYFEQQYRMKFAHDNGQLDGYFGFGFEADLAGHYEAKALYPQVAVMIAGIDGELFSHGLFPASLYYRFNPSLAHLFFELGDIQEINRWVVRASPEENSRYYPFDILGGKRLHASIRSAADSARLVYDHPLLYGSAEYLADIVAREGMRATHYRYIPGNGYDIRAAFFPASDIEMPFALIAAVIELNDQNAALPPQDRLDHPGWQDTNRGSHMKELRNRLTFFVRAEETVFEQGGFFPLFRPYVYAVPGLRAKGMAFDFYGYPKVDGIAKFTGEVSRPGGESGP